MINYFINHTIECLQVKMSALVGVSQLKKQSLYTLHSHWEVYQYRTLVEHKMVSKGI